jgi:SNF2 family DNA or RNA helicase
VLYNILRPYQQEASNFLLSRKKALLFDDMGIGKTLTALISVERSYPVEETRHTLILCPTNALYVWHEEIKKWLDKDALIYTGTKPQRKKLLVKHDSFPYQYVISTYGMLREISETFVNNKWHAIIADEIHVSAAGLLNHKTQNYSNFRKFVQDIEFVFLLTGTPIRQGVIDTYAPLSIVAPDKFTSYWVFVNRYCVTLQTPFGKSIERAPKNIESYRATMRHYMIRRTKSEVLKDMPAKQRQIIYVDKDKEQDSIYYELLDNMMTTYTDTPILTPNTMVTMLRLRQLLVCPKLLDLSLSYGNALKTIGEMGQTLLENGEPFVIFTPFREAIKLTKDYLLETLPNGVQIYTIQGGMKAEDFAEQWQTFQNSSNKNKVLLCVIKSGASFHATTASHAFFLGYEWDFNQNVQAEDRLCRIGQEKAVNIYYMMHKTTVDEDVAQKLNDKNDAADWVIGNQEQYHNLLARYKIKKRG